MTYPSGDEVVFGYGSGVDDAISRLTTLAEGANTVEVLLYLGLGTVVMRTHAETGVTLSSLKESGEADGDAGDRYTGLDRFGRVVDQRWVSGSNTDVERYQYGYDRAGNRLFKHNTVISDLSEQYAYDALGQLTDYQQGTPGDAVTRTQSWDLDPLGNWSTVTTDGVEITREHNAQNEITNIGETTTITYDANGNLTTDENDYRFGWDAWNRLVQVRDASDAVVARYGRDALGRRITVEQGETVTDRYFSSEWQLLEEKVGEDAVTRYVWSPVYVDALVLRDRDTDGNGSLDERLYPLQDANWNVTALVTPTGTVVERYSYDPYGQAMVRDGSGAVIAGSAMDWLFLHQGGEQIAAGDYEFRNRAYSPSLGRWLSNDPIGFEAGDNNWYRYEGNDPGNGADPEGLQEYHVGISIINTGDIVTTPASYWNWLLNSILIEVQSGKPDFEAIRMEIEKKIGKNGCIKSMTITGHGSPGKISGFLDKDQLLDGKPAKQLMDWIKTKQCKKHDIVTIKACSVAADENQDFIKKLSVTSGFPVKAWDNWYMAVATGKEYTANIDGTCKITGNTGLDGKRILRCIGYLK